ncbi:MAG TPA: HhH-GPD-type base excision DNA repair protein [Candidatus Dormibacteraeota bacterium]|jgi:uncharacterized HhH-GPD family protein|nr:HhH-GPD-type base excision DNA repair protein [Candidatus Dormibacteraeota bacterium]
MAQTVADATLHWTDDEAAAGLIATDPLALLIGFQLDQQVPMEWAFGAPETLRRRLAPHAAGAANGGRLDATTIAAMEPAQLEALYTAKPPLHRYPRSMARRGQELARIVVDEYGGDAGRIWGDGADAQTVVKRIAKLPGFSAGKGAVIVGVLAKRLGLPLAGWEKLAPTWFSLADVDSPQALQHYRELKRAAKKAGQWPPAQT